MFLFVGFSFKFASELFAELPKKIGVTLFDWLSCILPWLFHFKSYASRQQRTVNTGNEFIKIVLRYFCFVVFPIKNKLVTMIVIYHIIN